jgi:hypothetical protein
MPAAVAAPSAMPIVPAALAAPSTVPVIPVAPVAPPALVPSMPAMPPLRSLRTMVVPPVPPALPFPAGSRAPFGLARAPLAREDPFVLFLRLSASPSLSVAPHDAPLSYSAVAPLPAALSATGSEEKEVIASLHRCCSCRAGALARASAVVPERSPAVAAASRALSEVVVIDNDNDDDPHSGPEAVPRHLPPAPRAGCTSVLRRRVPLWHPAGIPLLAPDSPRPAEVGRVVLHGRWAEQEGRGPRLPYRFRIKKWKVDLLVVCEEDPRLSDRFTEYRNDQRGCILVGLLLAAFSLPCLY